MGKLENMLKFKKAVTVTDPSTGEKLWEGWVRLMGDEDLADAYKQGRIRSAEKRAQLLDSNSDEYKDAFAQLVEAPRENLEALILARRETDIIAEASVVVEREELPKIEEISTRPDAPSLEDQEKLDARKVEQDKSYAKRWKEFIDTRLAEIRAELEPLTLDELVSESIIHLAAAQAMETYVKEVQEQAGYYGTYVDEACTEREFSSVQAFKNSATEIKEQLIAAYQSLQPSDDEIKN